MELYIASLAEWHEWLDLNHHSNAGYTEWIKSAKKKETRLRRVEKIVGHSEKNIRLDYSRGCP